MKDAILHLGRNIGTGNSGEDAVEVQGRRSIKFVNIGDTRVFFVQ